MFVSRFIKKITCLFFGLIVYASGVQFSMAGTDSDDLGPLKSIPLVSRVYSCEVPISSMYISARASTVEEAKKCVASNRPVLEREYIEAIKYVRSKNNSSAEALLKKHFSIVSRIVNMPMVDSSLSQREMDEKYEEINRLRAEANSVWDSFVLEYKLGM